MTPASSRSSRRGPGPRILRTAGSLALALAAATLPGCASDGPTRPSVGQGPTFDRSDVVPSGLSDMREQLSAQRSETMSVMDAARPESAELSTDHGGDAWGTMLDAIGWATGRAIDVLSLQAFGLW